MIFIFIMFTYILKYLLFIFIINTCLNSCHSAKFPADIPRCKYEEYDCIIKVATDVVQNNPNGRPDLGIPQIEPFRVTSMRITQNASSSVNVDYRLHNVSIEGLSKLKFYKAVGFAKDAKSSVYELYSNVPQLRLKALYKTSGRIFFLNIKGEGETEIILDNVDFAVRIKPSVIIKNDKQYLQVEKIKMFISPSKMSINLTKLFNGDKVLSDEMNKFLNENWKEIWDVLAPSINAVNGEVIKSVMQNVFSKFAHDDLYAN